MSAAAASTAWLSTLATQCERTSQARVAHELGVSPTQINQALKGKYRGNLTRLRALVEGAYMHATVECPVLGELALHHCLDHQSRPFSSANPQRVMLYRACRGGCPHSHAREQ